jgi:hypothetical protein
LNDSFKGLNWLFPQSAQGPQRVPGVARKQPFNVEAQGRAVRRVPWSAVLGNV